MAFVRWQSCDHRLSSSSTAFCRVLLLRPLPFIIFHRLVSWCCCCDHCHSSSVWLCRRGTPDGRTPTLPFANPVPHVDTHSFSVRHCLLPCESLPSRLRRCLSCFSLRHYLPLPCESPLPSRQRRCLSYFSLRHCLCRVNHCLRGYGGASPASREGTALAM